MDPEACKRYNNFNHNLQLCVGSPRKTKSAYKVIFRLGFLSTHHFRDSTSSPGRKLIGKRAIVDRYEPMGLRNLALSLL